MGIIQIAHILFMGGILIVNPSLSNSNTEISSENKVKEVIVEDGSITTITESKNFKKIDYTNE